MAIEYDLIVIGNTSAGIHAAISAARLKARVALVEQDISEQKSISCYREVSQISQYLNRANQLGFYEPVNLKTLQWSRVKKWAGAIASNLQELNSPAVLSSLGIEFIAASGEFVRKPQPGFLVNGRLLRSRSYLITTHQTFSLPNIEGLNSVSYLTPDTAFQSLPSALVIIGNDEIAVELAQIFTRLGSQVTLIVPDFLPKVDREAAFLIQSQLEAEGVQVLSGMPVTQVKQIQSKKWVQVGNQAIEANEILLATEAQPNLERLNLEAMDIRSPVQINTKLQATNPKIYLSNTPYEAEIAVKNALFFPCFKVNNRLTLKLIFSSPELAWIGLTEAQATQKYGKDIFILKQYFKTLEKAQIQSELTGFCKVIVRQNGTVLGAHIVGAQASELITTMALAMQKKMKISAIGSLPFSEHNQLEILRNIASDFQHQKLKHNRRLQNLLEKFFKWQRNRK
ncbi:MAG: NAD(P)/FAD-dependent oxidoreductase [Leptolyngbyaceae cyanobacterium CSU_1_3]|nr:NAD(P)/FAD-dependent oxidoreductase [Leptolyngbyaceae cyanobacterium CSU_1_3]